MSYITSTFSESVLFLADGNPTSRALWRALATYFTQSFLANESNLRFQLLDLNKGFKSADEYLKHAKSLYDALCAIFDPDSDKEPVSNKDLVLVVLSGLGPDYHSLVTNLINAPALPDFSELRSRILAYKAHTPKSLSLSSQQGTALMTIQNPSTGYGGSSSDYSGSGRGGFHGRGGGGQGGHQGRPWQQSGWQNSLQHQQASYP